MLKVIYHGGCRDGYAAAWVVRRAVQDGLIDGIEDHPASVEYIAANYYDPPPDVVGHKVLIVDFSYKRPVIEEMVPVCEWMIVLDHHQTSAEDLAYLPDITDRDEFFEIGVPAHRASKVFDGLRSGARITWDFFYPDKVPPLALMAIEDRDLWRFEMKDTRPITTAIGSYPFEFDIWDEIMKGRSITRLTNEGVAIERYRSKSLEEMLPGLTQKIGFGGYVGQVANLPYIYASDAGHILSEGYPFGATYSIQPDGVLVSLRSREDGQDVAAIAEQFGGGGHKHAAGFKTDLRTIRDLLQ